MQPLAGCCSRDNPLAHQGLIEMFASQSDVSASSCEPLRELQRTRLSGPTADLFFDPRVASRMLPAPGGWV
jgi:hypothetical protein